MGFAEQIADLTKSVNGLVTTVKGQFSKWDNAVKAKENEVDMFLSASKSSFVGTEVIADDFTKTAKAMTGYGETGEIVIDVGILKHYVNADGYDAKQSTYFIDGEEKDVFPLHDAIKRKENSMLAIRAKITNSDNIRNYHLLTNVNNISPYSQSDNFATHGSAWIYFSRDVDININFAIALEYMANRMVYVDGQLFTRGKISKGWHEVTSFYRSGNISYSSIDILRFNLTKNDSLDDLTLLATLVSLQVNSEASAVIKMIKES